MGPKVNSKTLSIVEVRTSSSRFFIQCGVNKPILISLKAKSCFSFSLLSFCPIFYKSLREATVKSSVVQSGFRTHLLNWIMEYVRAYNDKSFDWMDHIILIWVLVGCLQYVLYKRYMSIWSFIKQVFNNIPERKKLDKASTGSIWVLNSSTFSHSAKYLYVCHPSDLIFPNNYDSCKPWYCYYQLLGGIVQQ